jgi:hypothetical protein
LEVKFVNTFHILRGRLNHAILHKRAHIINEGEGQRPINLKNAYVKIGNKETGALAVVGVGFGFLAIVRIAAGSPLKFADSLKINRPVFAFARHYLQVVKKRFEPRA